MEVDLPPGMTLPATALDPIAECQLAERLHMTVTRMRQEMSLHERAVTWPAYLAFKRREADRAEQKRESRRK